MKITKIYFDMDGVLSDFDRGLIELLKVEPKPQDDQPVQWQEEMWDGIKDYQHFFRDLKPIKGAIEAFNKIYEKYGSACEILSAVPKDRRGIIYARDDKREWIEKYLPEGIIVNLVYREEKINFCNGRDCILIDDYEINCTEWNNNGGSSVCFSNWEDALKLIESIENN